MSAGPAYPCTFDPSSPANCSGAVESTGRLASRTGREGHTRHRDQKRRAREGHRCRFVRESPSHRLTSSKIAPTRVSIREGKGEQLSCEAEEARPPPQPLNFPVGNRSRLPPWHTKRYRVAHSAMRGDKDKSPTTEPPSYPPLPSRRWGLLSSPEGKSSSKGLPTNERLE